MSIPSTSQKNKSSLKLVASDKPARFDGSGTESDAMVAGGLEASSEMEPGRYVAICQGARAFSKYDKDCYQLLWQIDDGPHAGTGLIQYVTIERFKNRVPLATPYGKQCLIAMGGEIEPGDRLDPDSVFAGKRCVVDVGFRKTKGQGGQSDEKLKFTRKANDFLRVHQVLALAEFRD